MGDDGGFSSSGDGGFSSSGDGGFSNSGDGGFSSSGDTGFSSSGGDGCFSSSGGNEGFKSSSGGNEGFKSSSGGDYSNDSKCYSIDQVEDNHAKWNQGPIITCDEPDKATYITDDGDNDKSHGLSYVYPALAAASFTKDPLPNENGEAPMSLLLDDSADVEEQSDGNRDGSDCGIADLLYCSLLCCCTVM